MQNHDSGLVSLVIPVFNERCGLESLVENALAAIERTEHEAEIVLVDDGSEDDTWELIGELSRNDSRISGISLSRNFGKESAILAGLNASNGQAVIVMDGDGQHPPEMIPAMIEKWNEGFEVVEGVKIKRADQRIVSTWASRVFNSVFSRAAGIDLTNASDFRLLSREVVEALLDLPERAFFFRGLSGWIGYSSAKVPFETAPRDQGRSKFSTWDLARYAVKNTIAFTSAPLHIVTLTGFIFAVFAILLGLQTLWKLFFGQAVEGFATVIILILIHGSVVMMALGLIGQYIAQIHHEVKRRPHYLIRSRTGGSDKTDRT